MKKQLFKDPRVSSGTIILLAIIFTFAVKFIDIRNIGPSGTGVGFGGINLITRNAIGYSEFWYQVSHYSGMLLVLPAAYFVILGFLDLKKKKSLKKVSREFKFLATLYISVVIVYLLFEKLIIINYRPILEDGAIAASYPSTHTLLAVTICGSALMVGRKLVKRDYYRFFNIAMIALMFVTVISRLLSGAHWLTDIIGGILISAALISFSSLLFPESKVKDESNIVPAEKETASSPKTKTKTESKAKTK